jgi:hypothetical protein
VPFQIIFDTIKIFLLRDGSFLVMVRMGAYYNKTIFASGSSQCLGDNENAIS